MLIPFGTAIGCGSTNGSVAKDVGDTTAEKNKKAVNKNEWLDLNGCFFCILQSLTKIN
jgi:hypothetical protein